MRPGLVCSHCQGEVGVTPEFDWWCDHCATSVLPALQGTRPDFTEVVLARFPLPLALLYQRVLDPENATQGFVNLIAAYISLIRFSTLVLVSQFLHSDLDSPSSAQALLRLRTPTVESWHTALFTLSKHLFSPPPGGAGGIPFSAALAASVRNLNAARVGSQSLSEAFRAFRNAEHGHRTNWTEADCREKLRTWRPALEWVFTLFLSLAEIEVLRRDGNAVTILRGISEPLPSEPIDDSRLEECFIQSELVLRNSSCDVLPLYPVFTVPARTPRGYLEDVLTFDGHELREMVFHGVRHRVLRLSGPLSNYLGLLDLKGAAASVSKAELRPWTLTEWAFARTHTSIQSLTGLKYFPEYYKERRRCGSVAGADDLVHSWLNNRPESAMLVTAPAGAGKTSLLCHVAEELLAIPINEQEVADPPTDCVLLLLGGELRLNDSISEPILFRRIRDGLGIRGDQKGVHSFEELLQAWRITSRQDRFGARRRLVILLDAVNESQEPKAILEQAAALAAAAAAANRLDGRNWVRLLLSIRSESLCALFRHWDERHDTSLLHQVHNFAHFEDERGQQVPYLELRTFTSAEAEEAYRHAQVVLRPSCQAAWPELAPGTQSLLQAPQMLALFHRVFAREAHPPTLETESALWRAWLDSLLSPERQQGNRILSLADELARFCIESGHSQIPDEVASLWRRRWEERLANDQIRIDAELNDVERLAVAGVVRQTPEGGWDWVSDSLAEHLFSRTLRRQSWPPSVEDMRKWLALPATPRLDGALTRLIADIWDDESIPVAIIGELVETGDRTRNILSDAMIGTVARLISKGTRPDLHRFDLRLTDLKNWTERAEAASVPDALLDLLLGRTALALDHRRGLAPPLLLILRVAEEMARQWASHDPNDTRALSYLALSYDRKGDLVARTDPDAARSAYEQSVLIRERIVSKEPSNTTAARDLSVTYNRLGDVSADSDPSLARRLWLLGLGIRERMAKTEPASLRAKRDLANTCSRLAQLGVVSRAGDSIAWAQRCLDLREELAQLNPTDPTVLRDLSLSYEQFGLLNWGGETAAEWYGRSLAIRERLSRSDPDNVRAQLDLAELYDHIGLLSLDSDPQRAEEQFLKGLAMLQSIVEEEPDDMRAQRSLALCFERLGSLNATNDPTVARAWFERTVPIRERLAANPANRPAQRDLWLSYFRLAQTCIALEAGDVAMTWIIQARRVADRLAELEPDDPFWQDARRTFGGALPKSLDPS